MIPLFFFFGLYSLLSKLFELMLDYDHLKSEGGCWLKRKISDKICRLCSALIILTRFSTLVLVHATITPALTLALGEVNLAVDRH